MLGLTYRRVEEQTITRVVYAAIWVITGCTFDPSGLAAVDGGDIDDPSRSDSGPDGDDPTSAARGDAGTRCNDWRSSFFDPCALATDEDSLDLLESGTYRYDTDTGLLRSPGGDVVSPFGLDLVQPNGESARLVVARRISIGPDTTMRVIGSASLLLASWSTLEVAGTIDASSHPGARGAGADPSICAPVAATSGQSSASGGGGGAGGGFAAPGGAGGDGHLSGGGIAGGPAALAMALRGGCPGGGGGAALSPGGSAGAGGGAIVLAARKSITISGRVEAGGGGGGGGKAGGSGGGGGGSGGMIVIEAAEVVIVSSASLIANGGGGGGGGWFQDGQDGHDGSAVEAAAGGVAGDPHSGDGGAGGDRYHSAGDDGRSADSGGGAGGGVGYIVLGAIELELAEGAAISPVVTVP